MNTNLYNMIRILRAQNNGLSICHLNAQSLTNKLGEFRYLFVDSKIDVVSVSETWFRPDVSDNFYSLTGYKLFRADRLSRTGGGSALYVRDGLSCKFEGKSDDDCPFEFLFASIICNNETILVGSVYRPYNHVSIVPLVTSLESISWCYSYTILCGDFNCNLLDNDLSENFRSTFEALNLNPVNCTTPTHFTNSSSSLLDLYLASDVDRVLAYSQLHASGFSRHDLIFTCLDVACEVGQQTFQYRDFKHINLHHLLKDFNDIDWNSLYLMGNVNDQVSFLGRNVNFLFNQHVPVKTCFVKLKAPPWLNGDILAVMSQRDAAYSQWRRYKVQHFRQTYSRLRNKVVKMVRTAKILFYEQKLGSSASIKNVWKNLKEMGICKQTKATSDDIDCDALNRKFTSMPQTTHTANYTLNIDELTDASSAFNFVGLQEEDIVEAIISIKSNAIGLDLIHPKFVKLLLPYLLPFITYIFNSILTTSEFPLEWKKAKIIPIPKKTTGIVPEFRPIAILPFLSKVFEKAVFKQIQLYLTLNNLLSPCQSGFRPHRSCKSALLLVTDEIRNRMDDDHLTLLTLLDFSKAFDTVNHSILCRKLSNIYGFSLQSCKLMLSYLSGRQQRVVINDRTSSLMSVMTGVPQGSILGPMLFSLYINELPLAVKNCVIHLYADDVQLVISRPFIDKNDIVSLMNEDLLRISNWSKQNNLCLNPVKSKTLPIYLKTFDLSILSPLKLDDETIDYVGSVRNLGMVFNRTLTWNDHINSAIGKVYASLRAFQVTKRFIPKKTKMLLAKTLLLPVLLYGCEVFCDLDYAMNRKLNVVYNNIARYVFNLRRYDHVSSFSLQICGCSLNNLLQFRQLSYLHQIIQTQEPDYLHSRLNFPHSTRSLVLIPSRYKYIKTQRQFFIHVIRLWNSLPIALRGIRATGRFKSLLFTYLANH